MQHSLLEGKTELHEPEVHGVRGAKGTGIQDQMQRHECGNVDSDFISPSRSFLGSAQTAGNTRAPCAHVYLHTEPTWYLHWLCAHHGSCCDGDSPNSIVQDYLCLSAAQISHGSPTAFP